MPDQPRLTRPLFLQQTASPRPMSALQWQGRRSVRAYVNADENPAPPIGCG